MSKILTVELSKDYGFVLLVTAAAHLQIFAASMAAAGQRRKFGVSYPDMGHGRYSAKLTDEQWVTFNSFQRVHYNYLEQIPTFTFAMLASGIWYPRVSASLGAIYILGRYMYATGYYNSGPQGRTTGFGVFSIANMSLLGTLVYASLKVMASLTFDG
ncbi:hypothetical protein SmJEL517_g03194 [Synchytrium microbalum]|uniref:Glutathione transferase n=1 Tax=Synchytrium microbalum TaxID=1806994 RepID=A0A507C8W6_9FUNG|nr:uncharacterized protein SmJEL517_g03194 [Synchytrium microbalum]TPX33973.1 hypothetical protein SmJEL517_g03194 [Synchytrium microbalum]